MKRKITICWMIFLGINVYSQEILPDSIFNDITLEELIITETSKTLDQKQAKSLATIDEF